MNSTPLVSIICLCYNHSPFIKEALESVCSQTYLNKEIIVVDDYSEDSSVAIIEEFIVNYPEIIFIRNEVNLGNCKSFNKALKIAKGEFIIDFATDDIMFSQRIENQIRIFQTLPPDYGVVYGGVILMDKNGDELPAEMTSDLPSGYIYSKVIEKYFISPPTMMIKKRVLDYLGGYDESLAYEDFDFWVRSSREFKYYFQEEAWTKKRIVKGSLSTFFSQKGETKLSESTYRVVLKALWLNNKEEENDALVVRINYEMRQAFYIQNYALVYKYFRLLKNLKRTGVLSLTIYLAACLKIPVFNIYKWYLNKRK